MSSPDPRSHEHIVASAAALGRLTESAEPAVVFASLAELCVPAFSDECAVEISAHPFAVHRVHFPESRADDSSGAAMGTVEIDRDLATTAGQHPCAVRVVFGWRGHIPSDGDRSVAALLVDRFEAVLRQEQLVATADAATEMSANLQTALSTSRRIGVAVGILMWNMRIGEDTAFQLLRTTSQRTNRKVRDIADDVVRTGTLPGYPALHPRDGSSSG